MKTVGIIGFGSFGEFLAQKLDAHARVRISSRTPDSIPIKWRASLEDISQCDYIIPAIPLDAYEAGLGRLHDMIRSDSVIVDVCSVKIKSVASIKSLLPNNRLVATHPLFGPESAADSLQGHTLVVCRDVSDQTEADSIAAFASSLGLHIKEVSSDEHDQQMATVHGLTFFIAQALDNMNLQDVSLHTGTFKKLLNLADVERHHTPELFKTIQLGNPYAEETRQRFIDEINTINGELQQ